MGEFCLRNSPELKCRAPLLLELPKRPSWGEPCPDDTTNNNRALIFCLFIPLFIVLVCCIILCLIRKCFRDIWNTILDCWHSIRNFFIRLCLSICRFCIGLWDTIRNCLCGPSDVRDGPERRDSYSSVPQKDDIETTNNAAVNAEAEKEDTADVEKGQDQAARGENVVGTNNMVVDDKSGAAIFADGEGATVGSGVTGNNESSMSENVDVKKGTDEPGKLAGGENVVGSDDMSMGNLSAATANSAGVDATIDSNAADGADTGKNESSV